MLRWLYIQLLWAHPAEFRYRFCDEMLEIFQLAGSLGERLHLLLDGVLSLLRQWVLRPEYRRSWQAAAVSNVPYDLLTFQQIEPYKPSRFALAQGGLLAILLLMGIVNAINHGGGKLRNYLIGMHRPGYGLIKVDRASMEAEKLNTTVESGADSDDPWRPFARSYFRIMRVLATLDTDGDLVISSSEMSAAPAILSKLDRNRDGKLDAEECGLLLGGDSGADARTIARYRRDFMRENPVLAALDADHDGEISAAEIANSTEALGTLDFNHDGSLRPQELIPNPAVSQAAALMTRFDTNDDGVIALQEIPKEEAAAMQNFLAAADRNHDGVVTRGELIVELAVRGAAQRELQLPLQFK